MAGYYCYSMGHKSEVVLQKWGSGVFSTGVFNSHMCYVTYSSFIIFLPTHEEIFKQMYECMLSFFFILYALSIQKYSNISMNRYTFQQFSLLPVLRAQQHFSAPYSCSVKDQSQFFFIVLQSKTDQMKFTSMMILVILFLFSSFYVNFC